MIIGARSNPSMSTPLSSFIVKSIGPTMRSRPVGTQPSLGRGQQCGEHLGIVLELEEAEHAPGVCVIRVEGVVDLRGDPTDHAPVAAGEEVLGLARA